MKQIRSFYQLETKNRILSSISKVIVIGSPSRYYNYAISSEWWNKWCDFVNVEFKSPDYLFNSWNYQETYLNKLNQDKHLQEINNVQIYLSESETEIKAPVSVRSETEVYCTQQSDKIFFENNKIVSSSRNDELSKLNHLNYHAIRNNYNTFLKDSDELKEKSKIFNSNELKFNNIHHSVMNCDDFYIRPGMIVNSKIVQINSMGDGVRLKPHLLELIDYVIIRSHEVWQYLKTWYGCDYEIRIPIEATDSESEISHISVK